ncbi:MAG: hypothetical protein H0X64_07670 [Gemmatimonadaceae bacterium]|nr:hypothetical protein [Gemmatimonadaceae bacterium]
MSRHLIKLVAVPVLASLLLATSPLPAATSSRVADATPAAQVEGRGIWEKALCIGCVAGFAAASGGTIAGVIIVGGLFPEYVAACGLTCMLAYSAT